jgi:hypothetical protein
MIESEGRVGYWQPVDEANGWVLGENDRFGTCAFAMVGNHWSIITTANGKLQILEDGEISRMDSVTTGFNPQDKTTDHGIVLEKLLIWWTEKGWISDSLLKPTDFHGITIDGIAATIRDYGAAYAWWRLPVDRDGNADFTDLAIIDAVPGTLGHAMLVVGSEPGWYYVVTWATIKRVSAAWVARYLGGAFAVSLPQWHKPGSLVA